MAAPDYLILAVVLISAIAGLVRGFLKEVISLITWVLALWLSFRLGESLIPYLGGTLRQPPYGLWAGRAIVFLAVMVLGTIIGAVVSHVVRLSMFSGLDRLLGFLLGMVRGVVMIGIAIVLGQSVKLDGEGWWKRSVLIPQVAPVADFVRAIAGDRLKSKA
jgi:membrane protein required for colicin V production